MLPTKKKLTNNDVRLYTVSYLKALATSFTFSVIACPLKQKYSVLKTLFADFYKRFMISSLDSRVSTKSDVLIYAV